jgi:hypothetical protein
MIVSALVTWKLALTGALGVAILLSALLPAPRRAMSGAGLRRLLLCALSCYVIGGLAWASNHAGLAGPVCAAGIATCSLAAWLSRGRDSGEPPRAEATLPPPSPDGPPELNWATFEREFRDYSQPPPEPQPEPARLG